MTKKQNIPVSRPFRTEHYEVVFEESDNAKLIGWIEYSEDRSTYEYWNERFVPHNSLMMVQIFNKIIELNKELRK